MNDISERDGKFYIVDDAGKPISVGYDTQALAEAGLAAPAPMVATAKPIPAPRTGTPVVEAPKPARIRTTYLSEAATLEAVTDGQIDVTLIRAGWSKNNRYYSKEALARAVDKFEGSKAYLDHPSKSDETNRPERSVKDIAGYYTNVKQADDGRLVGRLSLLGENGAFVRPLVDAALGGKPDLIGLSINALGKTSQGEAEGRKGIIVEDIAQANSTDIVTTPAAGGRFERLAASDDGFTSNLLAAMEFEEWREARPEFLDRLKREYADIWKDDSVKTTEAHASKLRETVTQKDIRIAELEAQNRAKDTAISDLSAANTRQKSAAYADRLLSESRLPTGWQTTLQPQLLAEANTGNWPGLIERERVKFASVRTSIPVQVNGAITRAGAHSVVSESRVPAPGEGAEAYGRRMGYLR